MNVEFKPAIHETFSNHAVKMDLVRTFLPDEYPNPMFAAVIVLAAAAGLGKLPRAGPGRAIALGASTRIWPYRPSIVTSQRTDLVEEVKTNLMQLENDQYIVVFGQKGVGEFAPLLFDRRRHPARRTQQAHSSATILHIFSLCRKVHRRR
jgi:hypothetical protein